MNYILLVVSTFCFIVYKTQDLGLNLKLIKYGKEADTCISSAIFFGLGIGFMAAAFFLTINSLF